MKHNNIESDVVDYVVDKLESIYREGIHEFEFKIVDAVIVMGENIEVHIALIDAQDFASSYDMSELEVANNLTELFAKDEFFKDGKKVKVTFEIDDWGNEDEWIKKTSNGVHIATQINNKMESIKWVL